MENDESGQKDEDSIETVKRIHTASPVQKSAIETQMMKKMKKLEEKFNQKITLANEAKKCSFGTLANLNKKNALDED